MKVYRVSFFIDGELYKRIVKASHIQEAINKVWGVYGFGEMQSLTCEIIADKILE